jgi:hypothetical protein
MNARGRKGRRPRETINHLGSEHSSFFSLLSVSLSLSLSRSEIARQPRDYWPNGWESTRPTPRRVILEIIAETVLALSTISGLFVASHRSLISATLIALASFRGIRGSLKKRGNATEPQRSTWSNQDHLVARDQSRIRFHRFVRCG